MVIPVHDINPVRRIPWVTYALIAINLIVFLRTPLVPFSWSGNTGNLADMCNLQGFLEHWAAIPRELIHHVMPATVPIGPGYYTPDGGGTCQIGAPGYTKFPELSVLTAMFLHGSWLHLLGNMLYLWIFGNNVEDRMGPLGFLMFYLFCGYAATYGFALAQPNSGTTLIGASGAIAGVLGAYIVLWPKARVWSLVPFFFFLPVKLPAWIVLGLWFGMQAYFSFGSIRASAEHNGSVAYLAHFIGFLIGVLIAWPLRRNTQPPPQTPPFRQGQVWRPPPNRY